MNRFMDLHEAGKSAELHRTRGISPAMLLGQVRNTAPFIFDELPATTPYLKTLREAAPDLSLSHLEYYRLCLSAHHGTVATFVPTDVDNQIRHRLWHPGLPLETLEAMADLVLESHAWDPTPVSTR